MTKAIAAAPLNGRSSNRRTHLHGALAALDAAGTLRRDLLDLAAKYDALAIFVLTQEPREYSRRGEPPKRGLLTCRAPPSRKCTVADISMGVRLSKATECEFSAERFRKRAARAREPLTRERF